MNASLSSRAMLPIKTLACLCCLLPVGCATHKAEPPTTAPAIVRPAQPATATPAASGDTALPRIQRTEEPIKQSQPVNPVQPPVKPATSTPAPAATPVKAPATNAKAVPPTPAKSDVVKPAPVTLTQSKPEPAKMTPAVAQAKTPEPASIAPPAAEPGKPAAAAPAVSLNDVPLSIHNQWILDRDESRCTLQSATQRMDDGQGGTKISLWLTSSELRFITESDIDLSYANTGIAIGEQHFALETIEHRTNPAFTRQRGALLNAMKGGQTLQLTLGFWPTWPVTHTYSVSFPLQHFAAAYAAWESCNTQLSQR